MNILGINGSPRKKWNTATLLQKTLEGAEAAGAETELVHVYDLPNFRGCTSCFACKRKGGKHSVCAMKDGLTPVLEKMQSTDALIIGSPLYFFQITSGLHALLERFMFSNMLYNKENNLLYPKKIPAAFIYTMGVSDAMMQRMGMEKLAFNQVTENFLKRLFGEMETLHSTDAYQFDDYSKYEADSMDVAQKTKHRDEVFPQDCQKAYELGKRLAEKAKA